MLDHSATYTAAQTAQVAGIPAGTLQNWFNRGVIVGHREIDIEGGGVQGKSRRFSFHAVMQISIAAALIKASGGMELRAAFVAAMEFAHTGGSGRATWTASEDSGVNPVRLPGFPFHYCFGDTLLACTKGNTTVVLHRPGTDAFSEITKKPGFADGFVVIDASAVFERFCDTVGLPPFAVLDATYPKAPTDR